jgi:hypothetical protein
VLIFYFKKYHFQSTILQREKKREKKPSLLVLKREFYLVFIFYKMQLVPCFHCLGKGYLLVQDQGDTEEIVSRTSVQQKDEKVGSGETKVDHKPFRDMILEKELKEFQKSQLPVPKSGRRKSGKPRVPPPPVPSLEEKTQRMKRSKSMVTLKECENDVFLKELMEAIERRSERIRLREKNLSFLNP